MVEKLDGSIDGYGFLYSWSGFFPLWVKGGCIWSSIWQSTSSSQQRGRDRYTGDYMLPTTFIIALSQTKIWTFVRFQNQLWNEFRTLKSYISHGAIFTVRGRKLSLQKRKTVFLRTKMAPSSKVWKMMFLFIAGIGLLLNKIIIKPSLKFGRTFPTGKWQLPAAKLPPGVERNHLQLGQRKPRSHLHKNKSKTSKNCCSNSCRIRQTWRRPGFLVAFCAQDISDKKDWSQNLRSMDKQSRWYNASKSMWIQVFVGDNSSDAHIFFAKVTW